MTESAGLLRIAPMLARVFSAAMNGVDAYPIEVEVNSGFGESLIVIVVSIYPHKIWDPLLNRRLSGRPFQTLP